MKEFTVKENAGFRLRVKSWKCLTPTDLNAIEFVQETMKDGEVDMSSTYQFFMTDSEMKLLAEKLVA
jgi:hypothetical protein